MPINPAGGIKKHHQTFLYEQRRCLNEIFEAAAAVYILWHNRRVCGKCCLVGTWGRPKLQPPTQLHSAANNSYYIHQKFHAYWGSYDAIPFSIILVACAKNRHRCSFKIFLTQRATFKTLPTLYSDHFVTCQLKMPIVQKKPDPSFHNDMIILSTRFIMFQWCKGAVEGFKDFSMVWSKTVREQTETKGTSNSLPHYDESHNVSTFLSIQGGEHKQKFYFAENCKLPAGVNIAQLFLCYKHSHFG